MGSFHLKGGAQNTIKHMYNFRIKLFTVCSKNQGFTVLCIPSIDSVGALIKQIQVQS